LPLLAAAAVVITVLTLGLVIRRSDNSPDRRPIAPPADTPAVTPPVTPGPGLSVGPIGPSPRGIIIYGLSGVEQAAVEVGGTPDTPTGSGVGTARTGPPSTDGP
jgi:hypothetical protein